MKNVAKYGKSDRRFRDQLFVDDLVQKNVHVHSITKKAIKKVRVRSNKQKRALVQKYNFKGGVLIFAENHLLQGCQS